MFDGRHHLIVRSDGATELYDHGVDTAETTNVAASSSDVVERLLPLPDAW